MGPNKVSDSNKVKRKVVRTMIPFKKEILAKYDKGVPVSDLATEYGMVKSTMSAILKYKDAIKSADIVKGVKVLMKHHLRQLKR